MYIKEQYHNLPLVSAEPHHLIRRDGTQREVTEEILSEHLLNVWINGRLTMRLVCIGEYLTELVLGRLLTEGIIRDTDDVMQIYLCEYGTRANVILRSSESAPCEDSSWVETTPTCCTGNHVLNRDFVQSPDLRPITPIPWKPEWIFHLADAFAEGTPLHQKTWATHSCFLARQDQILFQCEDIGRHNALDKAIGYGLRQGIHLSECMLYSSGRIPTDMVEKAIRAGIPIFVSKAAPTAEAVQMAKDYQITLICAARTDRMKVFSSPNVLPERPPLSGTLQ